MRQMTKEEREIIETFMEDHGRVHCTGCGCPMDPEVPGVTWLCSLCWIRRVTIGYGRFRACALP